jgi:hypothetical protein
MHPEPVYPGRSHHLPRAGRGEGSGACNFLDLPRGQTIVVSAGLERRGVPATVRARIWPGPRLESMWEDAGTSVGQLHTGFVDSSLQAS